MDSIPRNDSLENLVGEYNIFLRWPRRSLSRSTSGAGSLVGLPGEWLCQLATLG